MFGHIMDAWRTRALTVTLLLLLTLATVPRHTGAADITCSQCDTKDMGRRCITHPPAPQTCAGFSACITVATYRRNNKLSSFVRSCSPVPFPPACLAGLRRLTREPVTLCYWTCELEGCNSQWHTALSVPYQLLDLLRRRR